MRLLLIFLIPIIFSCGQNQTNAIKKSEEENKFKKYHIRSYEVKKYKYKFGEVDTSEFFVIERAEIDRSGNVTKLEEYHEGDVGKIWDEVSLITYNEKGDEIERKIYLPDGTLKSVTKNNYSNGKNTERLFYDTAGKITSKAIYRYDKDGVDVDMASYNANGELEYKTSYDRDSKGQIIREKTVSEDTSRIETVENIYEPAKFVSNRFYGSGDLKSSFVQTLDNKGRVIQANYASGDWKSRTDFKYDNRDLIIEKIEYSKLGEKEYFVKITYTNY